MRTLLIPCLAFALLAPAAPTHAQDLEPNDLCVRAQRAATIAAPAAFEGTTEPRDSATDVDFLVFSAAPGQALTVRASRRMLGVFDGRCRRLAGRLEGPVGIEVPASGSFIVGIGAEGDVELVGRDAPFSPTGPYTLEFDVQLPGAAGSIAGRLLDGFSRTPLRGDVSPLPAIALDRCEGDVCDRVTSTTTDSEGRFRLQRDRAGRRLRPGTYELSVFAENPEPTVFARFDVAEGQNVDLGDLAVTPPALSFGEVQPCTALPPQGGTCTFSARIRNVSPERLTGLARSMLWATPVVRRLFELSTRPGDTGVRRAPVDLAPFTSAEVSFSFAVPASVPQGTQLCPLLQLGRAPDPLFDVARIDVLFCIVKDGTRFRSMTAEEAAGVREQMAPALTH